MSNHSLYIDKITNSIDVAATGKSLDTEVHPLIPADLKTVLKKNGWPFNWKSELKYEGRQLYKLIVKGESNIQGLKNPLPERVLNYLFADRTVDLSLQKYIFWNKSLSSFAWNR
jgi:hypothetical protein